MRTCLVKTYDNMPPLSTISRRISFFLLNDSSEEAAKSTANWQLRNISETCKVPMTRSNRNNSDFSNFHFAVFSSFKIHFGVPWETGIYILIKQLPVFMYAAVKVVRPLLWAKINVRRKHFLVPSLTFAAQPVGKSRDSVGKTWVTFGLLWFSRPNF